MTSTAPAPDSSPNKSDKAPRAKDMGWPKLCSDDYAGQRAMRRLRVAISIVAFAVGESAHAAEPKPKPLVLKAGQELTFALNVANGVATPGPAALGKLGAAEARDGEIVVGLTPRDKDLYSQVMVTEKTAVAVDFVATGHIGEIVIDERVICGRLGAPFARRIGGVSWTVELHDFTVGKPCDPG